MLGVATVGTLAHEQLSYLVRQPHSVFHTVYPYTTSLTIHHLQEGDRVSVYRDMNPIFQTTKNGIVMADKGRLVIPVRVRKPGDENVFVRRSGIITTPMPPLKQEGAEVPWDGMEWVETPTRSSYAVELSPEPAAELAAVAVEQPMTFDL